MNDRYLYRAKRIDNGEWIVGSLIQTPYLGSLRSWISSEQEDKARLREISSNQAVWRAFEVRTDTICQCTGLKDRNGKLIWENDITLRTSVTGTHKGKIIYSSDGSFCQKNFETTFENLLIHSESYFEVIGNIFDNPELLESEG